MKVVYCQQQFKSCLLLMAHKRGMSTHRPVVHDPKKKEFSISLGGDKAVLQYAEMTPSVIDLEHTMVPISFQGQGIGGELAEAALKHAAENKLKSALTRCPLGRTALGPNKQGFTSVLIFNQVFISITGEYAGWSFMCFSVYGERRKSFKNDLKEYLKRVLDFFIRIKKPLNHRKKKKCN